MIVKIKINEDREVNCLRNNIGVIGENNATTLSFDFPQIFNDCQKQIVFNNSNGSYVYNLDSNVFEIPALLNVDKKIFMQIIIKGVDRYIWKSKICEFCLSDSLNNTGIAITDEIKLEQQQIDKNMIVSVVNPTYGDNIPYNKYTYEEIVYIIGQQLQEVRNAADSNMIVSSFNAILNEKNEPSYDDNGNPLITTETQEMVPLQQLEDTKQNMKFEVENAITSITGEDFSNCTWDKILVRIEELPIMTPDVKNNIEELNTIKAKSAETNLNDPVESIDFWGQIEAMTAADTQYITVLSTQMSWSVPVRMPKLDTSHITGVSTADGTGTLATSYAYLSPKITSFDVNVSGLGANGLAFGENTFVGGNRGMSSGNSLLEHAIFRGCQNIKNLRRVMNGVKTLKTVEFYDLGELSSLAYTFKNCVNLEEIAGSELNLTGLSSSALEDAFAGCSSLQNVRFKANTIGASISLSGSYQLTEASTLSLINGLIEDANCAVSFAAVTKNMCENSYAYESDGIWFNCESTHEGAETYSSIITDYKCWSIG